MQKLFLVTAILVILFMSNAYAKEVPFTQDDRDRLIRLETKVEEGFKATNQRIDNLGQVANQQIDNLGQRIVDLRDLVYIVIGGIIGLIGFVIWDRRTALAHAVKKNKELEEREEKIERALRELAAKDPKVAEVLRHVGLL